MRGLHAKHNAFNNKERNKMFKGRVICSRGAERFIEILSFIERKSMTCLLRDIFYDQNTK